MTHPGMGFKLELIKYDMEIHRRVDAHDELGGRLLLPDLVTLHFRREGVGKVTMRSDHISLTLQRLRVI